MDQKAPQKFIRTDGQASVLVVDEDPLMLMAMGSVLNMQGYRSVMARTEAIAKDSISSGEFDVLVLSIEELEAGCQFASRLRTAETTRDIPIIFLVPEHKADWNPKLSEHGGVFSVVKPIEPDQLIELVDKALWLPHIARGRTGTTNAHLSRQNDWVTISK